MSQNMKNVSWQQELETSSTPRSTTLRSCASLRAWSLIKQKFGSKWILRQPWKWTRCSELFPNIPTVGITALLFLLIKFFFLIIFGVTAELILIDKIALAFSRQWKYLEMSSSSDEDAGPLWIKVSRQVKSFHTQTKKNHTKQLSPWNWLLFQIFGHIFHRSSQRDLRPACRGFRWLALPAGVNTSVQQCNKLFERSVVAWRVNTLEYKACNAIW